MNFSSAKKEKFTVLFEEFINSYPNTPKGIKHIKSYSQQRESGCRNYQAILEAKAAGEDISDRVLLQLLPYRDTKNNREQAAWIHIAPAINKDLKTWFENSRWTKPEDWHQVAELIFYFINRCIKNQDTLSINCQDFHRSTYSKGLQTGYMTPILNALKPDGFILINNKSRVVINYFADTNYSHKLIDYPAINKLAWQLINDLSSIIDQFDLPALRQDDLFDMFCHWLVAEKKYNFKSGSVEGDRITEGAEDSINKLTLEKLNTKKEYSMSQIESDRYFSDNLYTMFEGIYKYGLEANALNIENDVKIPFIRVCNKVGDGLPSSLKNKLSPINTFFEQKFDESNYFDNDLYQIKYKLSYIPQSYSINNVFYKGVNFYIKLDLDSFSFGVNIQADHRNILFSNKNQQIIYFIERGTRILSLKDLEDVINIFMNVKIDLTKTEVFPYFSFSDNFFYVNGYSDYCDLNPEILFPTQEIAPISEEKLVKTIVETFNYFYLLVIIATSENYEQEIKEHLKIWNPKYKLEKYVDATYIEESQLKTWIKSITRKKQVIFYGSPGTGKTFIAENIAQYLTGGGDGFYELIQFHPAYSYEDFIQGIRPQTDSGQLSYNLVPGRFLEFCNKAAACKDKCVLIIDEINRANLAEVFGELMYLLEYREQEICLAGSQEKFKIPDNVYLIGTMNTADRSIALVDFALRRRFAFIKIAPNYDIITKFHQQHTELQVTGLITVLQEINNLIEDENYYLGVSFFLIETLAKDLENIWQMEIQPYLEEYFGDRFEEIKDYRWEKIKSRIVP